MKFVFGFIFSLAVGACMACGTIDMRYENYLSAQTDEQRFIELKFMICEPIVEKYHYGEDDTDKLFKMMEDALYRASELDKTKKVLDAKWKSDYYRDMALRIYIRFNLLNSSLKRNSDLLQSFDLGYGKKIGTTYKLLSTLDSKAWLKTDDGLSMNDMAYSQKLRSNVAAVYFD